MKGEGHDGTPAGAFRGDGATTFATASAATTQKPNTQRQSVTDTISAPRLGATTGTTMKTVMIKDIALAIRAPEYVSRTTAKVMTRGPAVPIPQTNRAA